MEKRFFRVQPLEGSFEGYTDGAYYEKERPSFTKEVGLQIVESFGSKNAYFDEEKDTFYFLELNHWEAYVGFDVEYKGENVHVYTIGAGRWCWETFEYIITSQEVHDRGEKILKAMQDLFPEYGLKTFYWSVDDPSNGQEDFVDLTLEFDGVVDDGTTIGIETGIGIVLTDVFWNGDGEEEEEEESEENFSLTDSEQSLIAKLLESENSELAQSIKNKLGV